MEYFKQLDVKTEVSFFWLRRDLRIDDNAGLHHALKEDKTIILVFIFDPNITDELPANDARITFIYERLLDLNQQLKEFQSALLILQGDPLEVWKLLSETYKIKKVYCNKDYEPYALKRDQQIKHLLIDKGIELTCFQDHLIFEPGEILSQNNEPYTVYTPFKNKWLSNLNSIDFKPYSNPQLSNFHKFNAELPSLKSLGFSTSLIKVKDYKLMNINNYHSKRDYPALNATTNLGPHLRFGTIGIRKLISETKNQSPTFLNELIWREFFIHILVHFPNVVSDNFRRKYDNIQWRNNEQEFEAWCNGKTGYPLVDAGMRELNTTGYMHNRVRMITAGFLCKHLLIDWRWGEAYFAKKLLDYELASNNGNWQWAAGTGCDAAPYFRIFNPITQQQKFDKNFDYIKRWVPEFGTPDYPPEIVEHKFARERALSMYKKAIL